MGSIVWRVRLVTFAVDSTKSVFFRTHFAIAYQFREEYTSNKNSEIFEKWK